MLLFIISESCVEVFLVYLLALLRADNFNLSLLAGKVLILHVSTLLHVFMFADFTFISY